MSLPATQAELEIRIKSAEDFGRGRLHGRILLIGLILLMCGWAVSLGRGRSVPMSLLDWVFASTLLILFAVPAILAAWRMDDAPR